MKIKAFVVKSPVKIGGLAPGAPFRFWIGQQGLCIRLEDRDQSYARWASLETGHVAEASRDCEVRIVDCEVIENG